MFKLKKFLVIYEVEYIIHEQRYWAMPSFYLLPLKQNKKLLEKEGRNATPTSTLKAWYQAKTKQ